MFTCLQRTHLVIALVLIGPIPLRSVTGLLTRHLVLYVTIVRRRAPLGTAGKRRRRAPLALALVTSFLYSFPISHGASVQLNVAVPRGAIPTLGSLEASGGGGALAMSGLDLVMPA